jgi:hypothetical protein
MIEAEFALKECTRLHEVDSMHERKVLMPSALGNILPEIMRLLGRFASLSVPECAGPYERAQRRVCCSSRHVILRTISVIACI